MKKRIVSMALTVFLASSLLTGCKIGDTDFVLDVTHVDRGCVFQMGDMECTMAEAKLYLCNYKNLYGVVHGVDLWNFEFEDNSLQDYVKSVTLSQLTKVYAMNLMAEEKEIELTQEEKKLCWDAADSYFQSLNGDEKDYISMTKSQLEEAFERYAVAEKLYRQMTEGIDQEISDDEARVIRLQQIYVYEESLAKEVAEKIAQDVDFETLASNYNKASSIERTAARGELPKEVEEVAFNLDDGQISSGIETENGFYFIKCISKYEKDLTEENKQVILVRREKEQFQDAYDAFVESEKKAINVKIWDSIQIDENLTIVTDSFFSTYDQFFGTTEEVVQ